MNFTRKGARIQRMTKNVRIELEARLLVDGKVEHQTDYDLQTELEFQAGRLLEPSWRAFDRHLDSQPDCDEDDRRLTIEHVENFLDDVSEYCGLASKALAEGDE
ncbi:MAG: hypothetical protein OXH70_17580 [Acidobacteria bacterium]|nr:hypothetical protein [Acidobacteriota bacterium]